MNLLVKNLSYCVLLDTYLIDFEDYNSPPSISDGLLYIHLGYLSMTAINELDLNFQSILNDNF